MTTRCLIFVVVWRAWAASTWPVHVTGMVVVEPAALHEPLSAGPSPTVKVSVAVPAAAHVKFALAAFGVSNGPLVRGPRVGDGARVRRDRPKRTPRRSCRPGRRRRALTEFHVAQLKVRGVDEGRAGLQSVAVVHCRRTETFVVARAVTANVAEPPQVVLPSVVVPRERCCSRCPRGCRRPRKADRLAILDLDRAVLARGSRSRSGPVMAHVAVASCFPREA